MFRPRDYLKIIIVSVFLSGCASTHSDTGKQTQLSNNQKPAVNSKQIDSSRTSASYPSGDFVMQDPGLAQELHLFAITTAQEHGLDLNKVENLLKTANYEPTAAKLMTPPAHKRRIKRAWLSYKKRHVDPIRIKRGISFWQQNRAQLDAVSRQSGVPQSIIVAIIGIETVYGQYTGKHRVLDTLATLGFKYPDPSRPERQAMFREQLADLIVLHEQNKINAYTVQGSFAGAMGLSQFMPTSLLKYAKDGDNDGQIDLLNSKADAIASIASFLLAHGWQPNEPVFAPVALTNSAKALVQDGLEPTISWQQLKSTGSQAKSSNNNSWQAHQLGVIDLRDEIRGTHEYRVATPNFFAITKYNRSYFYASSVADLAYEIASKMGYAYPY